MQPPYSELSSNILRTVAYFDIFDYPLTAEQIFFFLHVPSTSAEETSAEVEMLVMNGVLAKEKGYFFLAASNNTIVEKRIANEARAKRMLSYARHIAAFIKRFPFIRGIFITGSLSKNVAAVSSDIDFMIVTAPGRLWVSKTFLTLFRKIFLLGKSKYFCTNFYLSENGLPLNQRNFYTAIEVVTTKAIWNERLFLRFQKENGWTRTFFPNASVMIDTSLLISDSRSLLQYIAEFVLNILPLTTVDSFLMDSFHAHWKRVFKHLQQEQIDTRFIISPDISSNWPDDRQEPILREYREKLTVLGLE